MRMPKTAAGSATPAGTGQGTGPAEPAVPGARLHRVRRLGRLARRHWLMTILLLAGLVLRLLAQLAYRPALLYIDSLKYLYNAWAGTDPLGYKGVLKAILLVGNVQTVAGVQHVVGLAIGVAIYAVLLRRGAPRWLGAVAAAPVLLDAYELQIEQTIMPDVWFEALIVAGLVLLLWQRRPRAWAIALAGILLGLSATVAQIGEILVVPAVVYVVVAAGGWRRAIGSAVLMGVAFALPIVSYMSISEAINGHFWLSRSGTSIIYGRVAEAADCATLRVPAIERSLCPTPRQKRLGADGLDHDVTSPLNKFVAPFGTRESPYVSRFTKAVITQQPMRVAGAIASDTIRLFALHRVTVPGDTPIWRWQFQGNYPSYQNYIRTNADNVIIVGLKVPNTPSAYAYEPLNPSMGGKAIVIRPLAKFLRSYQQNGGYTPGPLYLLATVAGVLGSLTLLRRRRLAEPVPSRPVTDRDQAFACFLFLITPVVLLLASDIPEFSWRYQLPAIVTLPPAGALGIAVIIAWMRGRKPAPDGTTSRPAASDPASPGAPPAPDPATPAR
jgi:hypothetical protein